MRIFIVGAIAAILAGSGVILATAPVAGAESSCTGCSVYRGQAGNFIEVPTIGNATRRDNCLLGVGNDSNAVAILRISLNNCYGRHLAVDSNFGPKTQAAVRYAQSIEHIAVDGVYGPQTRDHLKWAAFSGRCARL
jgi:hypothetical protein